ncbi:MAG TPA: transposase [Ktedonobacterales bacterium]|nr:transposase [Ktedonobacterales bacterium]
MSLTHRGARLLNAALAFGQTTRAAPCQVARRAHGRSLARQGAGAYSANVVLPWKRPDRLIADKGYSYPRCRRLLRQRQIPHTIPERRDQEVRRTARPGRPLAFDKAIYARRNVVERCINRLKQWRGLATRYEKRATNYRAMVVIAAIVIWLES